MQADWVLRSLQDKAQGFAEEGAYFDISDRICKFLQRSKQKIRVITEFFCGCGFVSALSRFEKRLFDIPTFYKVKYLFKSSAITVKLCRLA